VRSIRTNRACGIGADDQVQETSSDGMSTRQTLTLGHERFRVGPWHADAATAYLALTPDVTRPSVAGLQRCLDRLGRDGYSSIITAALHPDEARPFLQAGFVEYDRLRVLSHDLTDLDPSRRPVEDRVQLRRARRGDRRAALAVDARAFPPFWRLDSAGLDEAISATPRSRFRVAELDGRTIGYAVTGRALSQGFLQRLATDPAHVGHGVGSALVVDALRWARRRHVLRVLVNTQSDNERALALYRQLGFRMTATDLVVLTRPVP
jgi:GNAT superfamily N-acetyltransferase